MAHGSKLAVGAAIIGNSFVTLAKTGAFMVTGSAAMLSESMHSLADTLNQVLLMVGIQRSTRRADPRFPFLWESSAQPAGRWHGSGEGPCHYFADTPYGAWAELLRH